MISIDSNILSEEFSFGDIRLFIIYAHQNNIYKPHNSYVIRSVDNKIETCIPINISLLEELDPKYAETFINSILNNLAFI